MTDYYCVMVGGIPAATFTSQSGVLKSLKFFSGHINIRIKKGQREPAQERSIRQKAQRVVCSQYGDYQSYPKPIKKGDFRL